jgi:glycine cleavage system H protein
MTAGSLRSWAGCVIPEDLLYDLDLDVWVALDGAEATVGMTDVAQTRSGRLVSIGWKRAGTLVRRGRPLGVIESSKWVGPFRSPLTAVVIGDNRASFSADIAAANRDPYGQGWLYRLRAERLDIEQALLVDAERAYAHYRELIDREGIRCFRCSE